MEKMSLIHLKNWDNVRISNPFTERSHIHAIQISAYNVLVFGGVCSYESYIMSIVNENAFCRSSSNLISDSMFYNTAAPVFDGNHVYGVDIHKNVHIYSVKEAKWEIIKHKSE